jgi:hypothetical protein
MTTFNNIVESKQSPFLTCDGCNSDNVQETIQGYVCGDCGLVLETHKLQYHRPYNEDIVQYAALGSTQIGTKIERMRSKHSVHLETLNKLHSFRDNEKKVVDDTKIEILRILGALKLPKSYLERIFPKVREIRAKFRPSTKYRSIEKLVPPILFYCLKNQGVSVNLVKLLEVAKITKSEFNHFRLQVKAHFPKWDKTKRQLYISQRLCELQNYFQLDMGFVFHAKKVMARLWPLIKNTTDDVIVGVSASITVLCFYKERVRINSICNRLGIQMSSIQFQVKKRIINNLHINGFTTLIQSSGLVQVVMEKLGVFKPEADKFSICNVIIEIKLGNAIQIFNHQRKEFDHYLFVVLTPDYSPIFIGLKIYNSQFEESSVELFPLELFELELCKYSHGKGPPSRKI